jgi:site-specific DNA recombinase
MSDFQAGVRCAIYTRKSTEEGLEQEFNTLQAQRESAEAYILSQKQNGWQGLAQTYEDGGFSGASLERPALQQLLADIEARKIDCVVVYKVDRLSRSLLDFARLLSLFEKHAVSFVSVTQEFNTTTSLGRLTLNILLSFAQFEREIISERTRDKMSAARRKGKWVGGTPVLGYDVGPAGGRLVVNQAEAEQVRQIFTLCAEVTSSSERLREVREHGFTTKDWTSRGGQHHGGRAFSSSTLKLLLRNVLYKGDICHKGTVFQGEHEGIVSRELWALVNQQQQVSVRAEIRKHPVEALLHRFLYCGQCGQPMSATYTVRQGRRYLYYVCRGGKKCDAPCRQKPVASADLEASLRKQLEAALGPQPSSLLVQQSLGRLSFDSDTRTVSVELRDHTRFAYSLPVAIRPGVRHATADASSQGRIPRVSRLMALAIKFQRLVSQGVVRNYRELAEAGHVSRARLCHIMMLANLAPTIQEALLFLPKTIRGRDSIAERQLRTIAGTIDWQKQMDLFRAFLVASVR